ncbi:MAG TPA: alpha/beta fold hydrolase [Allosphingosinicella sp.]|jgi:pimeloyl-ACP methyl ester carboxylesterase
MLLIEGLSGRARIPAGPIAADLPLVVAIHGGSYSSAYFDLPGFSLLDRAAANGIPIVAIDRPGHGETAPIADQSMAGQARHLTPILERLWREHGTGTAGIVLIAHSIGAGIAAKIAADPGDLPLLGLAMSGVGLRTPTAHGPMWNALPETLHVDLPGHIKDEVMFGPPGSFDPAMPAASHDADAPAVRAELVDIVGTWHNDVHEVLGRIAVPVHYRQPEVDKLWIVDENEVGGFGAALTASPRVDAAMVRGTGHCMDFHRVGAALQLQQLGFALQCAAQS